MNAKAFLRMVRTNQVFTWSKVSELHIVFSDFNLIVDCYRDSRL